MKLYLAAIYTSNFHTKSQAFLRATPAEQYYRKAVRYYLESYHYIWKQTYIDKIKEDGVKIFLDSGAFSAFSKGAKIDLPAYCEYIKLNHEVIERSEDGDLLASVLDGIGDPLLTWQNQQYMEQLGVKPLPCFHYGEDERYLEWYMARYPYITIGGMVPINTPQLYLWLDRIWEKYLCDGSGKAKLKVHGFGLTNVGLMERYPWYSVDSSSWVQIAANGGIWIPGWGAIFVSKNSPNIHEPHRHVDNMSPAYRQAVVDYVTKVGYDMDRLQNDYIARWSFCCWSFTELNNITNRQNKRFIAEQPSLF
jgi:hypothetical protein